MNKAFLKLFKHEATGKMLKEFLLLLCLLILPVGATAQHCPFDGGRMIVVYLTNAEDKPLTSVADNLVLREIDNPNPEACTYAKGLLTIPFLPPLDNFLKRYKSQDTAAFKELCAGCGFLTKGYYAVIIGQAESTCMIKKDNDFNYVKRKFEIRFTQNKSEQTAQVPNDQIYSLCTDAGKWSRMVPIDFKIKE